MNGTVEPQGLKSELFTGHGISFAPTASMADPGKVYPIDVHLLRTEIQVQGELLSQERLERKAEVDELHFEIAVLRKLLEESTPDFQARYDRMIREQREKYDPGRRATINRAS